MNASAKITLAFPDYKESSTDSCHPGKDAYIGCEEAGSLCFAVVLGEEKQDVSEDQRNLFL